LKKSFLSLILATVPARSHLLLAHTISLSPTFGLNIILTTPKPCGGHPSKLSDTDIHHAMHLINLGKADNAAQVTQILQNITNTTLSTEAVCLRLKGAGWKAVVKKK